MKSHNFKFKSAFAILTVIIIILIGIFVASQYWGFSASKQQYETIESRNKKRMDDFLDLVLTERAKDIRHDTEMKANKFADELIQIYGNDRESFEKDLANISNGNRLSNLLDKHFSGQYFSDSNKYEDYMLVAINDDIIYEKSGLYPFKENQRRTFNDIIFKSYNPELTSKTVDCILNYNVDRHDYLFWESSPNPSIDHMKIKNLSVEELMDLYEKEKLEGFKSIDLLAVVYITDDGDIFGVKDVSELGYIQDNYKISVIQRVNMYSIILEYQSYIDRYVADEQILRNYFASNDKNITILVTISLVALIIVLLAYAIIQNNWIKNDENNNIE